MKKLFLLTITAALSVSAFAQVAKFSITTKKEGQLATRNFTTTNRTANKTTTIVTHDSLVMDNLGVNDTIPYIVPVNQGSGSDSGTFFGTSVYGFDGFAERYDFNGTDSSVQVLGVIAGLTGSAASPSTHTAVFKVWTMGAPEMASTNVYFSGFPDAVLDSSTVPYSSLTFNNLDAYWFSTPTSYLTSSFFVGFTTDYNYASMNGDSLAVFISGNRLSSFDTIVASDTIINDQSAAHFNGVWNDNGLGIFQSPLSADYYLFPIVNTKSGTASVKITNKNFTFFGNYPNPAVSSTNIKFSLATATDVTISVMDMNGRVVSTINQDNLSAGQHIINLSTANMAAGDYVYVIRAANGGGIASKLTVIK